MSYHYRNSRVSTEKWEPVYLTKFNTVWVLPPALRARFGTELITEQTIEIAGLNTDKMPEELIQKYKFVNRKFTGSVVDTSVDLEFVMEVNVDPKTKAMVPYDRMKAWGQLCYDFNSGFQGLKSDYTGSCTIQMHDKVGDVLKEWFCPIIWPKTAPNAFDLKSAEEGNYKLSMTFHAENVTAQDYTGS